MVCCNYLSIIISSQLDYYSFWIIVFKYFKSYFFHFSRRYLRKRGSLNFRGLFKYPFIKTYLLFAIYVIFISLDDRFLNLIVTYIPNLFISFGLGFFLIESGNDYKRFIKILALQAFVFSLLILLDYFHITNISLMMRQLSPGYNEELTQQNLVRAGIERGRNRWRFY